MKNSRSITYLTKDYEAFRAYFLESVGDRSLGLSMAALLVSLNLPRPKQVYKKVHFTTRLVGVLQKYWQF